MNGRRTHNTMKKVNNDIQNITQKTKHQATSNPLKLGANSGAPEGIAVPVLHDTRCVYC